MAQLKNKGVDKTVGNRVSGAIQNAGFDTHIKFCERHDFDYQTLRSIMGGHVTVNAPTLKRLSDVLKVSTDYLLGLTEVRTGDADAMAASKEYGLTGEALDTLKGMAKYPNDINTPALAMLNAILLDGSAAAQFLNIATWIISIGEHEDNTPKPPRGYAGGVDWVDGFSPDKVIYNMGNDALRVGVALSLCSIIDRAAPEYRRLIGGADTTTTKKKGAKNGKH